MRSDICGPLCRGCPRQSIRCSRRTPPRLVMSMPIAVAMSMVMGVPVVMAVPMVGHARWCSWMTSSWLQQLSSSSPIRRISHSLALGEARGRAPPSRERRRRNWSRTRRKWP